MIIDYPDKEFESYEEISKYTVAWYRKNGKYKERIRKDNEGKEYVIGDWWWNMAHPDQQEYFEKAKKENNFKASDYKRGYNSGYVAAMRKYRKTG